MGTGGATLVSGSRASVSPNSEVRDNKTRGVLKLTLRRAGYDWQFIPVAGKSFTDAGSAPCSASASAVTRRTFEPESNATVFAHDPDAAGKSTSLIVDAKPESRAYLRFTVSGLAGPVRRVTLRLYVTDGSRDGPPVYEAATDWSEAAVSWSRRPARLGLLGDLGRSKKGSWISLDVGRVVKSDGTYAFELAPTSRDGTAFSSRRAKSNRPELVVEASPAFPTETGTTP